MSKEMDLIDTMSMASTVDGQGTPTHTTTTEHCRDYTESVPYPGATFIIRHRDSGKVITIVNGDLRLCEGFNPRGGFHWECIERDRWLGFRNCVSGTIIGHNDRKKFIARVDHHQSHEYFTLQPSPQGGYELLMRHGQELWSMAVGDDGSELVEVKGEGALWDFLKA
ncbi:dynamin family [Fusarium tjaetaba]|uniref:Dynamin family n=1 Tax=Fusarium tjaetaba TaxID=1567544 RepID=A0A8H5REK0_9HYPO|nr:dynamin family [Fusarium tjaetaba]KAF5631643.1 dynamin family [Fusarium tjaetaba]